VSAFQTGNEVHGSEGIGQSLHQVYDGFQDYGTAGSQEGLGVDSAHFLDLLDDQQLAAANCQDVSFLFFILSYLIVILSYYLATSGIEPQDL